jgi:transposase
MAEPQEGGAAKRLWRRPNRERQNLVTEQTRIVNQMKAIFARFGIRTFRPTLRKAEEKLKGLRTAEGSPLPENTRTELCRHLTRLRVVREQIRAVEQERLRKLEAMRRALPELLKLDRYERRASAVPRYAHQLHGHVSHAVFKREIS